MRSKRFGISVIIQSVVLALTGAAVVTILLKDYLVITKVSIMLVWIFQIISLIRSVNRTNREFENFLESLKYLDKVKISGSGKSLRSLNLTYGKVIDLLRTERAARETEFHYFRDTVEHINTGLISISENGEINIMNRAAKEILNCQDCSRIEQLGEKVSPALLETIQSLEIGRPRLAILHIGEKIVKLSFNLALLKIQEEYVRLVSLADIKGELEEGELEAWQKLTRVLTHEIVNSVTPINTLTTTMLSQLSKSIPQENELTQNLSSGIQAIRKRNNGLLAFVENFRRINKVPKPDIQTVRIGDIFNNLKSFLKEEFKRIELLFKVEDELTIEADEELIIQLLINLLKNAFEAGANKIEIIAKFGPMDRPQILVCDNGKGIDKENIDNVFIPFYSTKSEASGIGLGLSRQIMRLHRGSISVDSASGSGAVFTLTF